MHAVENVSLDLMPGEVLGLLGHNGAGKSTLIKILSGVFPADCGEIRVAGQPVTIRSTRDAKALGIETIYQNLALSENLDAIANLFLGREISGRLGFMNEEAMEEAARTTLQRMKLRLPSLSNLVASLSGGQRQAVAIARAVHFNARVLIMDEPTAALGTRGDPQGRRAHPRAGAARASASSSSATTSTTSSTSPTACRDEERPAGRQRPHRGGRQGPGAGDDHRRRAAHKGRRVNVDAHIHFWRLARGDNLALTARWRRSTGTSSRRT